MKKLLFSCYWFLLVACSHQEEQAVLILDYDDFGPSALSHSVIGSPWWQWLPHGDGDPKTHYAIKILVHKYDDYIPPPQYSVSEQEQRDFRSIHCADALEFFEISIPVANGMAQTGSSVLKQLKQTQEKVMEYCT